ncbi:MAG: hypothetical protein R2688_01460 [Fimbriimonadaceae bacterium]
MLQRGFGGFFGKGMKLEASVRRAIKAASISVTRPGAVPSMPNSEEYDG